VETGESVLVVDRGGIGAGASGRNGGFLFRQPATWIVDLLDEALLWYRELEEDGTVSFDLREWPMLLLAVEEAELPHARAYAEAVGGEEVDVRAAARLTGCLIGRGVSIGAHARVTPGAVLGDGTHLGDYSLLPDGVRL
jgi:glycine/D-amino acid oxidase-like deaminating enzyme